MSWGIVVRAADNAWEKSVQIPGQDWQVSLHPPGEIDTPLPPNKPSGPLRWRKVPYCCALVTVRCDGMDINAARDYGRRAVRALLPLVRREIPVLNVKEILWEGALVRTSKKKFGMTTALAQMAAQQPAASSQLSKAGLALAEVAIKQAPSHLQRALYWLSLARSANVLTERFMHLWLAVLSLASFERPVSDSDKKRVRNYVATMGTGVGGVTSQARIEAMTARLEKAYKARNRLFHRDDESLVMPALVDALERDVYDLVDFELRKLEMPISH